MKEGSIMKKTHNLTNPIAKAMIRAVIDPEPREWPPKCSALIYQPQRPIVCKPRSSEKTKKE